MSVMSVMCNSLERSPSFSRKESASVSPIFMTSFFQVFAFFIFLHVLLNDHTSVHDEFISLSGVQLRTSFLKLGGSPWELGGSSLMLLQGLLSKQAARGHK